MKLRDSSFARTTTAFAASLTLLSLPSVHAETPAEAKAEFESVSKHLDLGGHLFGYVNVQGDFDTLSTKAQEVFGHLVEMSGGEIPLPKDTDIAAILKELGLNNVSSLGMSSVKQSKGFRNKLFLGVKGERQGLLKMSGGKPKAFSVAKMAPSNASIAFEQALALEVLRDVVSAVAKRLEPAIGTNPVEGGLQMPVPMTNMNLNQIITKLSGEVSGFATLLDDQTLEIPDAQQLKIPAFDFVVAHDSGRWLFDLAEELLTSNAPDMVEVTDNDGVKTMVLSLPPQATLGFFKPCFRVFGKGDRLLIASRPEGLASMDGAKQRLADDADFKAATKGLPTEGNGFSYISKDAFESLLKMYGAILGADGAPPELVEMQKRVMEMAYGDPQAMAAVLVNKPDGVYMESVQPQSYKQTMAVMAIVPVAVGAAVTAPMMRMNF